MTSLEMEKKYFSSGPYTVIDILAILIALGIGVLIIMVSDEWINKLIGIFGIFAILTRIKSRIPFVFVLICVISMPVAQVFEQKLLVENLAICAFYFLLISIGLAALETQPHRELEAATARMWGNRRHMHIAGFKPNFSHTVIKNHTTPTVQKNTPTPRMQQEARPKQQKIIIDPTFFKRHTQER